jgi:AcrR family transcriptional regulator
VADARRERWRVHRQTRRQEFVEATIRAVTEHGPDVGMDEIAAAAGVSKPVLYRHFNDKADLHLAVGLRATELLMSQIVPALADDGAILERIRRAVGCYLRFVDEYQELYRFLVLRPDPTKSALVQDDRNKIAAVLTEMLAAYMKIFRLDTRLAGPSAYGIVGLVQGAGEWWLDHHDELTREQLVGHLSTLIWHSIDGVLRSGGVVVDPNQPLSLTSSQLRLIVGGKS